MMVTLGVLTICSTPKIQPALAGTNWQLNRVAKEGKTHSPFHDGQRISFVSTTKLTGNDGCNSITAEYESSPKDGSFRIRSFSQTVVDCVIKDVKTGESKSWGAEFSDALIHSVAYEIRGNELWLYYPEDKSKMMVFIKVD
jgi:heat shock protein HslJ